MGFFVSSEIFLFF